MNAPAIEGQPHGIITDWTYKPRKGHTHPPLDWTTFTHWDQVYKAVEENPSQNYRINIRNFRLLAQLNGAVVIG